jgi:hypothetical protein
VLTVLLCNNTNKIYHTIAFIKKKIYFCKTFLAIMIQRIQTIYLFLTLLTVGVLPYIFSLWILDNGKEYFFMQNQFFVILLGLSTAITAYSIISFKKRQTQFVLNRLNIILNLVLLGLFVYHSLNISGETPVVSEKGIGMFLPILAIVLLVLANKAIKKDEDLVKSVDRLR